MVIVVIDTERRLLTHRDHGEYCEDSTYVHVHNASPETIQRYGKSQVPVPVSRHRRIERWRPEPWIH